VIRLLSRQDGNELTFADLEEKTGLPSTTVRRVVEDLVVLGLVDQRKETAAQNSRWLVRESLTASDYWDSEESS
jgi:DNA-binding IclR family transcriptional regulator